MSLSVYTYDFSDFPEGTVNTNTLIKEVRASNSIITAIDYVNTDNTLVSMWFKAALSMDEETALDSIVATHDSSPEAPTTVTVSIDTPKTADGKQIVLPNLFPGGVYLYFTGYDDGDNSVGEGQFLGLESDTAEDKTLEFSFTDWVYIAGGMLLTQGGHFGDYISLVIKAPATPVTPNNTNTGNCNIVGGVMLVPAAGNGTHDADLSQATPLPSYDDGQQPSGYWDWTYPDIQAGTVTPAASPGHAEWNLFAIDIDLLRPVNKSPLLGDRTINFTIPAIKPKTVLRQWKYLITLHNTGHSGLKACLQMTLARKRTL